jgi:protein-disulfide isomerase
MKCLLFAFGIFASFDSSATYKSSVKANIYNDHSLKQEKDNKDDSFLSHLKSVEFPEKFRLKDIIVGKVNAPTTVIIYSSYTCPHCREFHKNEYPKFKKRCIDTGKVKVIFKNYLDDNGALEAAQIIRCFSHHSAEKYLQLTNIIFQHQVEWLRSKEPAGFLKKIFTNLKFTLTQVNTCLKRTDIGAGLMIEQKRAMQEFHISSVPAFVVNGKVHHGTISSDELEKMCTTGNN